MKSHLPNFRFSWAVTLLSVSLALTMLWCARWQWRRYHEKKALVATYETLSDVAPLPFPALAGSAAAFASVMNRKVAVRGTWDYEREFIVTNHRNAEGPGHWLFTPLRLEGSEHAVLVSRGFIPFADREPPDWKKYRFDASERLLAVVKPSQRKMLFGPRNPAPPPGHRLARLWYFVETERAAEALPYPLITPVFLQRLGPPPRGRYPEQAVSIEVPPQVHFGYTIEWILLSLVTLTVGFAVQAWPWRKRRSSRFDAQD